jgi:hypothetical protein
LQKLIDGSNNRKPTRLSSRQTMLTQRRRNRSLKDKIAPLKIERDNAVLVFL